MNRIKRIAKIFLSITLGILIFVLLVNSYKSWNANNSAFYTPNQSDGEYSLGFEIGDYFEFCCTELDTTGLNSVFGGDWASDVGDYLWWCGYVAPSAVGEKAKFAIVNITDHPSYTDWWLFTVDGWEWIDKINAFGLSPTCDDKTYNFPLDPAGEMWNPSVWIITKPIDLCISVFSYDVGYSFHDNIINYSGTDVGNYEVNWIYDENNSISIVFN
ncbi:MAG: hypothetical protein ACFFE5_07725, partial [Candidatus Thorarchaeota archaeon]